MANRNRLVSIIVFAITIMGLGIVGLLAPDSVPLWNPVPVNGIPHKVLIDIGAIISLLSGIALLVQRLAVVGARLLCATLMLWLLSFRLTNFLYASVFEACWAMFPLAVMGIASWAIYVWLASDWDHEHLSFLSSNKGLRLAHALYGLSLMFFGVAHFIDLKDTLSLIPHWLPAHLFWAYFTGCAFIGAGIAILGGLWARLAAALAALQIGLFLLLVWIPIVAAGSRVSSQWSETFLNATLLACAWIIAELWGAPNTSTS